MYTSCLNQNERHFTLSRVQILSLDAQNLNLIFLVMLVFDVPSTNNDIILKSSKMKSVNAHSTFRNMNPCIIAQ